MTFIEPVTLQLVSHALDAASLRHQAVALNIANANVTGARPARVQFEQLLADIPARLAGGGRVDAAEVPAARLTIGSGDISLDEEMTALSSNSLHYQALARALSRHLGIVSLAIQDGRR